MLSKFGEVTNKDFGKINGLFVKDVVEEFVKESEVNIRDIDNWKIINKSVTKLTAEIVRDNFLNIVDGRF